MSRSRTLLRRLAALTIVPLLGISLGSYGFNDTISSAYFDGFLSC